MADASGTATNLQFSPEIIERMRAMQDARAAQAAPAGDGSGGLLELLKYLITGRQAKLNAVSAQGLGAVPPGQVLSPEEKFLRTGASR